MKLVGVSWSDCGDSKTPVKISAVQVAPDPLILPGTLKVGFKAESSEDLVRGSPLKVRMEKKVGFFWVKVPCQNDGSGNRIGSCDYKDFCNHWPLPGPECAQSYKDHGIPCSCPFARGKYSMPLLPVGDIKQVHIPQWLERGDFRMKAWIERPGSSDVLACLNLSLRLDHP